ncbi:MAG: LysM peptidoglycan-binding domain-containing protein [Clostridia bacterium]|nr:LysM peptidoglycan-binding domain-containing protein [Clostridia bacterium]
MKIVNLPKFIIFMIIVMFLISFVTSMLTKTVFSASPTEYETIVVAKGDTIWSIASDIGGNIDKNVHEIKEINNIPNSIIYVGQELKIPVNFHAN